MDIENKRKKIRKTRLIFYPILILTLLMFINSLIKPAYNTSQEFAANQMITELFNLVYKIIPPLKWVKGISPNFNIHELSSIGSILSILVFGTFFFSAMRIVNSNTESTRLKKLKQEVEDENIRNQFRENK